MLVHSRIFAPQRAKEMQVVAYVERHGPATRRVLADATGMRDLDDAGVRHIYAVDPPQRGIGRAIADRLRRAARRGPTPDVSPDHSR